MRKGRQDGGSARLRAAMACIGLVMVGVWVNLVGYGEVFLEPAMTGASLEATRYAYHAGRVAAAVAMLLAPSALKRAEGVLSLCVPLVMCFCTLAFALAFNQTLFAPLALAGAASFALGLAYLWVVATLYISLARMLTLRRAILVTFAAQVAEQVASVAANYCLGPKAQIAACCICLLVVFAVMASLGGKAGVEDEGAIPLAGAARSHTLLLLVMVGVAIVALNAVSNVGVWGNVRVEYVADVQGAFVQTLVSCTLLAAFVVGSLLPVVDRPLSYRYQVPFLVIAGSFMLAVLQPYAPGWASDAIADILTGSEYFSHVLMWTILMGAVKARAGSPYFLAGACLAPYAACSLGWVILLETSQGASMLFALAVSYLLVIVVAVHPRLLYERRQSTLTSADDLNEYTIEGEPEIPVESNGAAVTDLITRRCKLVGERYRLSKREVQVLALLAQGRSRPAIQEMLVLSEGTVKTHTAHIYEKMHVNSHQEVLDIVYGSDEKTAP